MTAISPRRRPHGVLPPRLAEVARFVQRDRPMADIGTDHAQLPAVLVRDGIVPSAIAIDNKAGPVRHARQTLRQMGVRAVEVRRGDGLCPLQVGEVDTITLAGLGGARIIALLQACPWLHRLPRLVLQPNTDWAAVRRWIADRHFALLEETMVGERVGGREHTYLTLVVDPTVAVHSPWATDDDALRFGPSLSASRPPAWRAWIAAEHERLTRALARAEAAGATDLAGLHAALSRVQGQQGA